MFRQYVEYFLGPTLRPGDIVVMDNLAVHKVAGIAEGIHTRGARVEYLPPYSPDFNRSCSKSVVFLYDGLA